MREFIDLANSNNTDLMDKIGNLSVRPWQIDRGRAIQLGHLRGWGLEYGSLAEQIGAQRDFQDAMALATTRGSLLTPGKLMNLYLIIKYGLPQLEAGDILEFGSYKGGSAIFMASLLRSQGSGAKVFALDTYAGMPETDAVRDLHHKGDFIDTSIDDFRKTIHANGLDAWVMPVQGVFSDTFPSLVADGRKIALAHVDCDIYDGVKYAINESKPHMVPDGYIVFDDPLHGSCLGAMQAIEETLLHEDRLFAEQMYPHPVYRYPPLA